MHFLVMREYTGRLALPSLDVSAANSYVVLGVASGCTLLGYWAWRRSGREKAKTVAGEKSMNGKKKKGEEGKKCAANHSIYCGRVWHSRYIPSIHKFNYPIFFFAVDLDEPQTMFPWYMYPLISSKYPAIARFNPKNHLKDHPLLAGYTHIHIFVCSTWMCDEFGVSRAFVCTCPASAVLFIVTC